MTKRQKSLRKKIETDFELLLARLRTKYETIQKIKIPWLIFVCAEENPAIIQHMKDNLVDGELEPEELLTLRQEEMGLLGKEIASKVSDCYGIIYITFANSKNNWSVTYIQYSVDQDVRIYTESMERDADKWYVSAPKQSEIIINREGWITKKSGKQPKIVSEVLDKLIVSYRLYAMMANV